jgi:hypothetical protein
LELGDSDTKEPFDWFMPEFRFWTLGVLADDTRRRDTSRDGWDELGELLQSANKLALWTDRADSLTGLIPGVIEMRISRMNYSSYFMQWNRKDGCFYWPLWDSIALRRRKASAKVERLYESKSFFRIQMIFQSIKINYLQTNNFIILVVKSLF